jgi:DNA repair protein RecO (recombination protein O)
MIGKTSGLVLHSIPYGETSLVVRILTREYGMQSYLVQGVRKQKAKMHQNLFQPFTLLDLVVYHNTHGGLGRIKEADCLDSRSCIVMDMVKTSIAIFLAELLVNSLKFSESSDQMFDFINNAITRLDKTKEKISDFHLVFMILLSRHFGFFPRNNYDEKKCWFNLREGHFQNEYIPGYSLEQDTSQKLNALLTADLDNLQVLEIDPISRRELLYSLIDYYRMHLEGLKEMYSHVVLQEVLK